MNNISDWSNLAPRIGIAWARALAAAGPERRWFAAGLVCSTTASIRISTLDATRFNGVNQQQLIIPNPDFFT